MGLQCFYQRFISLVICKSLTSFSSNLFLNDLIIIVNITSHKFLCVFSLFLYRNFTYFYADFVTCTLLFFINSNSLLIKSGFFVYNGLSSTSWDHLVFSFPVCLSFMSFSSLLCLKLYLKSQHSFLIREPSVMCLIILHIMYLK